MPIEGAIHLRSHSIPLSIIGVSIQHLHSHPPGLGWQIASAWWYLWQPVCQQCAWCPAWCPTVFSLRHAVSPEEAARNVRNLEMIWSCAPCPCLRWRTPKDWDWWNRPTRRHLHVKRNRFGWINYHNGRFNQKYCFYDWDIKRQKVEFWRPFWKTPSTESSPHFP